MRNSSLVAGLLAATLAGASAHAQRRPQTGGDRPTLIVFLTVDQMRSDYVDRWKDQYTGGLARLGKQGAFFTNAFQDHANTETAPGHSVTMAGRFPRSTGIVSNTTGVLDPQAPLLTSRDSPASPYRFRGSVLMDWLRTRDARSKGLSVSRKDRGAILPFGRAKQNVFWYATSNGEYTTSKYYADTLPTWIRRINARNGSFSSPRAHMRNRTPSGWRTLTRTTRFPTACRSTVRARRRSFHTPHGMTSSRWPSRSRGSRRLASAPVPPQTYSRCRSRRATMSAIGTDQIRASNTTTTFGSTDR